MEPDTANPSSPAAPTLARRMARYRSLGTPCLELHDQIFRRLGPVIETSVPDASPLSRADCRMLIRTLGGSIVQWTDGFRPDNQPSEWYSVVCRKSRSMAEHTSNFRRKLRHGLRACEVRQMTCEEMADAGYAVYRSAAANYAGAIAPVGPEQFRNGVLREASFPDLWHNWGVFAEGRLVGYAQVEIFGGGYANYSSIKLDPAYLKLYSSYALFHTMNEYYLEAMGFSYVFNGARSISHDTHIHEFLIHHFGFEKAFTTLNLYYRWPLRWMVGMLYPFRKLLGRPASRLQKILLLEQYRRESRMPCRPGGNCLPHRS